MVISLGTRYLLRFSCGMFELETSITGTLFGYLHRILSDSDTLFLTMDMKVCIQHCNFYCLRMNAISNDAPIDTVAATRTALYHWLLFAEGVSAKVSDGATLADDCNAGTSVNDGELGKTGEA